MLASFHLHPRNWNPFGLFPAVDRGTRRALRDESDRARRWTSRKWPTTNDWCLCFSSCILLHHLAKQHKNNRKKRPRWWGCYLRRDSSYYITHCAPPHLYFSHYDCCLLITREMRSNSRGSTRDSNTTDARLWNTHSCCCCNNFTHQEPSTTFSLSSVPPVCLHPPGVFQLVPLCFSLSPVYYYYCYTCQLTWQLCQGRRKSFILWDCPTCWQLSFIVIRNLIFSHLL